MKGILRLLSGLLAALLLLVGAALVLDWAFNRPPVPMAKLNAIRKGMSQKEVQAALGKPTSTYETNSKWANSAPFGWSIVYVYFDEHGRFEKYDYDY